MVKVSPKNGSPQGPE